MASEHQVPQRVQRTPSSQEQREGGGAWGVWRTGSQKKAVSVSVVFVTNLRGDSEVASVWALHASPIPALDGYGVGANKARLGRVGKGFRGRGKEGGGGMERAGHVCWPNLGVAKHNTANPPHPFPLPPLQDKKSATQGAMAGTPGTCIHLYRALHAEGTSFITPGQNNTWSPHTQQQRIHAHQVAA